MLMVASSCLLTQNFNEIRRTYDRRGKTWVIRWWCEKTSWGSFFLSGLGVIFVFFLGGMIQWLLVLNLHLFITMYLVLQRGWWGITFVDVAMSSIAVDIVWCDVTLDHWTWDQSKNKESRWWFQTFFVFTPIFTKHFRYLKWRYRAL